jgi:DeoR/GlpR family transcriptional regulator of sugar metabolism
LVEDVNSTIPELAALIGVTEQSIERNIKKLQEQGRMGPAMGGHWEIVE